MSAAAHRAGACAGAHVVLAAGGTGGHMVPADALAQALRRRGLGVSLLTDARGLRFPGLLEGVERTEMESAAPGRLDPLALARAAGRIAAGARRARAHLRARAAAAVVGFGGYPAVPALLAAIGAGRPAILHEQNAVMGRANRLLAPHVQAVALSYAETARVPAGARRRAVVTGNPVRPAVLRARGLPFRPPAPDAPWRLLVLGGSQGARILAAVVPAALAALPADLRGRLQVAMQCRPEDLAAAGAALAQAGIAAECAPYFTDLPERMGEAHLVVARAGASTVAELAAVGRPAILVPFAAATDDHQSANARPFVAAGAGRMLPEADCTSARLAEAIASCLADPAALEAAAAAARSLGAPDAAERLADLVEAEMAAPARGRAA